MDTITVLNEAKNYIVTKGWRGAGQEFRPGGAACVIEAVYEVTPDRDVDCETVQTMYVVRQDALWAITNVLSLRDPCAIMSWNDAPERTEEDVIAVFDAALDSMKTPEVG